MFEQRERTTELMDGEKFDNDLAEASYRFIERTNRLFGGISSVRNFIRHQFDIDPKKQTLHVLDLGSGGCDIPVALCHWALQNGLKVTFSCIEKNCHAVDHARRRIREAGSLSIRLVEKDIFSFLEQTEERFDCATASMLFHHLDEKEIGALLQSLQKVIQGPLLISDLKRSPASYWGCWLYTLCSHEGVKMDARTSVRRSFSLLELKQILSGNPSVKDSVVASHGFLRIQAVVHFLKSY